MVEKKPKLEGTVGEALIEQNKEVVKLLTSVNSKLDRLNILESLKKQNEDKLEKAEVIANLLAGIGRNQEQTKLGKGTSLEKPLDFNPATLDNLPWRPGKYDSSWIFADTQGAEKLRALIRESPNNEVPIGNCKYKISRGRDKEFINRTAL